MSDIHNLEQSSSAESEVYENEWLQPPITYQLKDLDSPQIIDNKAITVYSMNVFYIFLWIMCPFILNVINEIIFQILLASAILMCLTSISSVRRRYNYL